MFNKSLGMIDLTTSYSKIWVENRDRAAQILKVKSADNDLGHKALKGRQTPCGERWIRKAAVSEGEE